MHMCVCVKTRTYSDVSILFSDFHSEKFFSHLRFNKILKFLIILFIHREIIHAFFYYADSLYLFSKISST